MQWDQLRIGQCYVVTGSWLACRLSGVPLKIIAKSCPFILVEWQDDGVVSTLDTRDCSFGTVDKKYLAAFRRREVVNGDPPPNRCINCGTVMHQSFRGEWVYVCPTCGSLGGPVDAA